MLGPKNRSQGDQQQVGYSSAQRDDRTAITRGAKATVMRIKEKPRSDTNLPISIYLPFSSSVYFARDSPGDSLRSFPFVFLSASWIVHPKRGAFPNAQRNSLEICHQHSTFNRPVSLEAKPARQTARLELRNAHGRLPEIQVEQSPQFRRQLSRTLCCVRLNAGSARSPQDYLDRTSIC